MEVQVPIVVRRFSERYANDSHGLDLRRAINKKKQARNSLFLSVLIGIPFSLYMVYAVFSQIEQGAAVAVGFFSFVVIAFSVWKISDSRKTYVRARQRYVQCELDKQEGVVDLRLRDGLYYLAHQLMMRANCADALMWKMDEIHRARLAGRPLKIGDRPMTPGEARERMSSFVKKANWFAEAVQEELDTVAGVIEQYRGLDSGVPGPTVREVLHRIMSSSYGDARLHVRLQAIFYEPDGLMVHHFERVARWKLDGNKSIKELEDILHELLFRDYLDKWNDDLPEWTLPTKPSSVTE